MFRENAKVTDPKAINMLIYKGREELEMVLMQHKQRHHLIDKYVKRPAHKVPTPYDASTSSEFMQKFLA
ncbi:hypothetical protein H632_c261p0 [Helicosporidium sp. ATCC 50920]|nr:hypothetical protein H632_c261p0 [Helicosporidium sp. ATCC 50920]|eukprot:KDD76341.1 hypothetical protein H632_c261p0 [Helicosporidium sp. ATCC 50920]